MSDENTQEQTETVEGGGTTRVRTTDAEFAKVYLGEFKTAKAEDRKPEIANIQPGFTPHMAATTVRQKAGALRKAGAAMPTFPKGKTASTLTQEEKDAARVAAVNAVIAELADEDESTDTE